MNQGVRKEEVLEMLMGMYDNLERMDQEMSGSMCDLRNDLLNIQSRRLEECGTKLAALEAKMAIFEVSRQQMMDEYRERGSLKLEMGY